MYGFESLDEMEQTIPEFDDVPCSTWWRLFLEVFFKRAFVGKLKASFVRYLFEDKGVRVGIINLLTQLVDGNLYRG